MSMDIGTQYSRVVIHNRIVFTTITSSGPTAYQWIQDIKNTYDNPGCRLIVGLDIEILHLPRAGHPPIPRVATVQFSVAQRCLVFRMFLAGFLPHPLIQFLLDSVSNCFVGVGMRDKLELLMHEAGVRSVMCYSELRTLVARFYNLRQPHVGLGLTELASIVVPSLEFVRPEGSRHDWTALIPSYEAVEYACLGAYISLRIGLALLGPMPRL